MVVAGLLVDDLATPAALLAARRRTPPALAGRWEFPGGKVEEGEDPVAALHRELAEELGVLVDLGRELANPDGPSWPISATYEMRIWFAAVRSGTPRAAVDHDDLRWLAVTELGDVGWLPTDAEVVAQLSRSLMC